MCGSMEEKIIKSFDGTNLYYKIKKGKGKAFLFVHGLSGNHTVWKPSMKHFAAKGCTVVGLDLHGHGYSYKSRNKSRYSIDNFAKDIKSVIDAESLSNVVLVGISLGGMAILTYEKEYGVGTDQLVIMGTSHSNPLKYGLLGNFSFMFSPFFHMFAHTVGWIGSKFKQYKWPYLDYSQFGNHNAFTIVYHDLKASPFYSYFWSAATMFKYDIRSHLHKIKKPVLLLVGGKDFVIDKQASYDIANLVVDGRVKEIAYADHLIPMRYPQEMNRLIEEFVFE